MPRVGNKHYPYTKKGKADALAARSNRSARGSRGLGISDAMRGDYGPAVSDRGGYGPISGQGPAPTVRDGDRRGFAPPGRAPVIGKNPYKGTTKKRKTNPSPYSTSDR